MATTEREATGKTWDATNFAAKENLLRVVRNEAERFFELADSADRWEAPTASGHWQVRDIVGHLVDVTEGYLDRFEVTRSGNEPQALAGLTDMATTADQRAQAFRDVPREEMMPRLRKDFDQVMQLFESLSESDWTGLTVTHGYMGPLPAFIYPVFQLMDYGVHSWDIREGMGSAHFLNADAADLLVPFMFILWQSTTDTSKLEGGKLDVGIRVSGRNGGTFCVSCTEEGFTYEPGDVDGYATILDFDPASLVLTAFGRARTGTVSGDMDGARRLGNLFFRI